MNKNIVTKLLQGQSVNLEEINSFIVDYVKMMKNEEINSQQLEIIRELIKRHTFDLGYAAKLASIKLGMNVVNLYDRNGQIISTTVYDS